MKTLLLFLAFAASPAAAASRHDPHAPLPPDSWQPLGSPGIHASGNDCAPDRAEAAWSRDHRLLGYYCVRLGPPR